MRGDEGTGDGRRHRHWVRQIEMDDGRSLTYSARAASDPETIKVLDELARAAYKHFIQQREEQADSSDE